MAGKLSLLLSGLVLRNSDAQSIDQVHHDIAAGNVKQSESIYDGFLRNVLLGLRKELVGSRLEEQVAVGVVHLRPQALLDQLMHLLTSRAALHGDEAAE